MKKHLVIIIVLTLLALWPFFKKGFFESHDGEWMIIRFTAFHQTLTSSQIPVRFTDRLNNNYGYPVLNFLYPAPFYFTEIPKVLGFSFINSIKITFITTTLLSTIFMFLALSQKFSKDASLAAALLYVYVPYRFVDLYVRGSIGENFAFAILPFILLTIYKIEKNNMKFLPILSIGVAILMLSHNVIAFLFLPIFLIISALTVKLHFQKILLFSLLGILISAFFTLPAIYDLQYVKLSQIKVSEIEHHMASVINLLVPSWGFGSTPQGAEKFSPQLGLATQLLFIVSILFYKKFKNDKTVTFLQLLIIISAFFMLSISLPFWKNIPFADIIQFPWRLLAVVVFASSLLAAYVLNNVKDKRIIIFVILLAIASNIIYTIPKQFTDKNDSYYATNESTTTVRDEYMPIWVKNIPSARPSQKFDLIGDGDIKMTSIKSSNYKATVTAREDLVLVVNTVYFPGHQLIVNGQPTAIDYQDSGLIRAKLPIGEHEAIIKFGKTPVHLLSEITSILALFTTGTFFVVYSRKKQNEK